MELQFYTAGLDGRHLDFWSRMEFPAVFLYKEGQVVSGTVCMELGVAAQVAASKK